MQPTNCTGTFMYQYAADVQTCPPLVLASNNKTLSPHLPPPKFAELSEADCQNLPYDDKTEIESLGCFSCRGNDKSWLGLENHLVEYHKMKAAVSAVASAAVSSWQYMM